MKSVKIGFLSVGHGDSSVIIFPDGKSAAVIDTPKAQITFDYLVEHKIDSLKWVIISHTHADHSNGIIDLIKHFHKQRGTIEIIYYNRDTISENQKNRYKNRYIVLLREILSLINRNIVQNPGKPALMSSTFDTNENITIKILHPDHDDITKAIACSHRKNDASVVVQLLFGKFSILFTGDLSAHGWKWLKARNLNLSSDILKYPHHGAWFKDIPDLIDNINPQYVILSYGESSEKRYSLPAPVTINYLKTKKIKTFSTKSSHQEFAITLRSIKHI